MPSPNDTFLPAILARNTVESLYAEHGSGRPWIYWLLLMFCAAGLGALPLVRVDVTVRAPGIVRPVIERAELKTTLNGRIARVLARDNERVAAGQALLELSTRDVEERLARNRAQQRDKADILADLALLTGDALAPNGQVETWRSQMEQPRQAAPAAGPAGNAKIPLGTGSRGTGVSRDTGGLRGTGDSPVGLRDMGDSPMPSGKAPFSAIESRASRPCHVLDPDQPELPEGAFRTLEYHQSYLQARAQLEANRLALAKARGDLARVEALATKGLVSPSDLDTARFSASNAAAQDVLIARQAVNAWKSLRRAEQTARDDLVSDEKRLEEEMTYSTVRAPVAGTVQGFLGLTEGGYVIAGQSLGFVSPDTALLVETSVSPRDVGLVRAGQLARLQIDAFPYTQWGLLPAKVSQIAADATLNGQQLYFRVLLSPQTGTLRLPNGVEGSLRKGMTLTARFVVNRRTLLQALYETTADWLNPQSGGATAGG
jgi:multidrug resistance efflux pump